MENILAYQVTRWFTEKARYAIIIIVVLIATQITLHWIAASWMTTWILMTIGFYLFSVALRIINMKIPKEILDKDTGGIIAGFTIASLVPYIGFAVGIAGIIFAIKETIFDDDYNIQYLKDALWLKNSDYLYDEFYATSDES